METFNLEPVVAVVLTGMVAGVVELIKRIFKKDWKAVATIVGAGVTGALVVLPFAVNPLFGAVVGLASSGFITIAQHVSN